MTSFTKENTAADPTAQDTAETTPPKEEPKTETKPEEKALVISPKLMANPKLWRKAMDLAQMLNYCRPHMSVTESRFINTYLSGPGFTKDAKGNIHKRIGTAPVLWSCHTDTVHNTGGMQKIVYWVDKHTGDMFFGLDTKETANCLGADDTTGVWVMLEMIKAKVPGYYIFHRGEECNGIGSKWIAKETPEVLKDIKFAIAFDRRDTDSIITFQTGKRCCSDEFAKGLAEQLALGHRCDETGMWTDTASYVDLVAECTNISTGYYGAHGSGEKLNVDYLFRLRDAMVKIDVSKLIEKRKPGENTSRYPAYTYESSKRGGWWEDEYNSTYKKNTQRPHGSFTEDQLDKLYGKGEWHKWFMFDRTVMYWKLRTGITIPKKAAKPVKKDGGVTKGWKLYDNDSDLKTASDYVKMAKVIKDNSVIIADMLESHGYELSHIKDYVAVAGGYLEEEETKDYGMWM